MDFSLKQNCSWLSEGSTSVTTMYWWDFCRKWKNFLNVGYFSGQITTAVSSWRLILSSLEVNLRYSNAGQNLTLKRPYQCFYVLAHLLQINNMPTNFFAVWKSSCRDLKRTGFVRFTLLYGSADLTTVEADMIFISIRPLHQHSGEPYAVIQPKTLKSSTLPQCSAIWQGGTLANQARARYAW